LPDNVLTIVGTGITLGQHTALAESYIKNADKVLYFVPDVAAAQWLQSINGSSESLLGFYGAGKARDTVYDEIIEHTITFLREGLRVCLVLFGHPGFASIGPEVARRAVAAGYHAELLPAISSFDCLFADLGIDPLKDGCQIYDAEDFVSKRRRPDRSMNVVLLQPVMTGSSTVQPAPGGVEALVERLGELYGDEHEVVLYQAATLPGIGPRIQKLPLRDVTTVELTSLTTMFIPPLGEAS
jgi:uncharacterized protein YabN with tetrapyrrole methylase and pyrophosphatase domain